MRQLMLFLLIAACWLSPKTSTATAQNIHEQQLTFPGGTVRFFLRGTNLIYERVCYPLNTPPGPTNWWTVQTNWVERFYCNDQLVLRRCSVMQQINVTTLGVAGVGIHQGEAPIGATRKWRMLEITESGKNPTAEGTDWTLRFELFLLHEDGFYYPDPDQGAPSSMIWFTDVRAMPSEDSVERLRTRLLTHKTGEPVAGPNSR